MEKRDIIVIIVAIIIVLIMAMYIKPLVTGKEAKLIPDEISNFFENNRKGNDSIKEGKIQPINGSIQNYSKPSIKSITPNESYADSNTHIEIEGNNLKKSMNIMVFSDSHNITVNTTMVNDKIVGQNVSLSKGDWIVKIFDPELNITYNTQHVIRVITTLTPEPTWDEKPKPLSVTSYTNNYYTGRSYPVDPVKKDVTFKTYSNFSGVTSVNTAPINIPYPYWDIIYTIVFQTEIANPQDNKLFEFNREYKEPLILYEGEPIIYYEKGSMIPSILSVKKKGEESKTEFRPSKDTVIAKTMQEDPDKYPPYETKKEGIRYSLVESVGYQKPIFKIILINEDFGKSSKIEISPPGGIDPLQWDEAKHKDEAKKMMIQKGLKEEYESDEYKKNWEDKWKTIKDPRPWRERIFGKGNYSFQIIAQGIESYNIKIEIPNIDINSEKGNSNNLTTLEMNNIKGKLYSFKDEYNNILLNKNNNLSSYYSLDKSNSDNINAIIADYKQNRAGGVVIEDINLNDIRIKGQYNSDGALKIANTATVKGQIILERNGYTRSVPIDVDLQKQGSEWKLTSPIKLRF